MGMGPVVSKNVKVDDLSLEQLKGIFSGQITNWKEVGGDDAKIVVLNRKAGSGTRATFEAAVFGDEAVDFKATPSSTVRRRPDSDGSTDNAISYLDFSHFDDSKFNAIKVEGVEPKSANVTDDSFKIWLPSTCTAPRTPTRPPRPSWSSCFPTTSRASSSRSRALSPSLP